MHVNITSINEIYNLVEIFFNLTKQVLHALDVSNFRFFFNSIIIKVIKNLFIFNHLVNFICTLLTIFKEKNELELSICNASTLSFIGNGK